MKTEQIQVPDGYELRQVSEGKWELVKEEGALKQIEKYKKEKQHHFHF